MCVDIQQLLGQLQSLPATIQACLPHLRETDKNTAEPVSQRTKKEDSEDSNSTDSDDEDKIQARTRCLDLRDELKTDFISRSYMTHYDLMKK